MLHSKSISNHPLAFLSISRPNATIMASNLSTWLPNPMARPMVSFFSTVMLWVCSLAMCPRHWSNGSVNFSYSLHNAAHTGCFNEDNWWHYRFVDLSRGYSRGNGADVRPILYEFTNRIVIPVDSLSDILRLLVAQ